MKKIFLVLSIVIFAFQLKAQFIYDEWDEIVPFTLTEEYGRSIDTSKINTIMLPGFNNDSLFWANNPPDVFKKFNASNACGFEIDSIVDFFSAATKFEIPIGTIWLLRIESPTAEEIGLDFPIPSLPEGALFSYFTFNLEGYGDYPETFDKEKIEKEIIEKNRITPFNGIYARGNGNHLIVEYFHPKGVKHRPILKSKNIVYYYDNGFNTKEKKGSYKKEIKTDTTSLNLKSGYFGNAFFSCHKDVACTTAWDDMKKAVVYIQFDFTTPDQAIYKSKGTGVLINKAGNGYALTDKPFLITCGHLFSADYNGQKIDIRSTISKLSYYVFYENKSCNESTKRGGKLLSGSSSFNIVKIGSSFATEPNNSFYNPSEDFAIIEASKTVKTYSKLNVEYAGWDTFFDLSNSILKTG